MQAELKQIPFPTTKEGQKKGEKTAQTLQDFLLPWLVEGTVSSTNNAFTDYIFPS